MQIGDLILFIYFIFCTVDYFVLQICFTGDTDIVPGRNTRQKKEKDMERLNVRKIWIKLHTQIKEFFFFRMRNRAS